MKESRLLLLLLTFLPLPLDVSVVADDDNDGDTGHTEGEEFCRGLKRNKAE